MKTNPVHLCGALVALGLLVPATAGAQHFPDDEDVQVMLDYLVEDGEAPGIVLGLLEADGFRRILTAGTAGPDARPLGPRSVFEIGSINKTFTGALLADMVARGEVALDDPVARYMPEDVRVPSRNGREITLLDLATHRSGLPRLPDNHVPADMGNPYADYTVQKLYDFLSSHELRRDPGAEVEYSNLGFGVLGHALARAAGVPYRDLLRERILDPLGMDRTGYALEGELAEWMVKGHSENGGEVVPYWFATEAIEGAGGLRSNVEDMLRYLAANVRPPDSRVDRALHAAQEVRQPHLEGSGVGLGWWTDPYQDRLIVNHSGGTGGFSARIGFDPALGVGFVLLANANDFGDDLGMDLLRFGRPFDGPDIAVDPGVLDRYDGEYRIAPGRSIRVRHEEDGTLTMQTPGNVRFRLYPESDTSFYLKRAPWRVSFRGEADGRAAELALTTQGGTRTIPRAGTGREVLDLAVTEEEIDRYEGTYLLELGEERTLELRIFGRDDRLVSQAAGQSEAPLRYQGDHVFVPSFDDRVRLVFTVEDGRATSVTLHQGGGVFTGDRRR